MALSNEDKKDVAVTFGKKAADAVSSATRDYATAPASKASKFRGKHSTGSNFNAKTAYENLSRYRRMSGDSSKSKALKSKTGGVKSYQPDQMYSDAAMKRFSAKRKRLGHND